MPVSTVNLGQLLGPEPQQDLAGTIAPAVQTGIQLATAQDQVQRSRMQVQNQKIELAQKQATSMMNRTKAAMFAQSPAAFDSIMKANEAYANSIGVPYNAEALRAAWKDPNLKLAAQREINRVMAGGQLQDPQAIIDFFGSDSPAIFQQLEQASYAAGVKGKEQAFELEKQRRQIQAQKDIATMGLAKADQKEQVQIRKEGRANLKKLNDDYSNVNEALGRLKSVKDKLGKYTAESVGGTGPIATLGGLTTIASQKTEALESAFKTVALKNMVEMFAGMSKAIDTGAERRAFESTQASITQDDATNMEILNNQIAALERTKAKIENARQGISSFETVSEQELDQFMKQNGLNPSQREAARAALQAAKSGGQ